MAHRIFGNSGIRSLGCDFVRVVLASLLSLVCARSSFAFMQAASPVPSIFKAESTPADSIHRLSVFVLIITGLIFLVVFSLLVYATAKFRKRPSDDNREPPQVYGSNQIELAWTVIPVLIVLVLFFATARVIQSVQDAIPPASTIRVTAIGHQFWWEFRYPALGVVTANELHIPVSDRGRPTPTFVTLLSADTDHSFWIPQLAGKTDLIPNRVNSMWIDPHSTGMYLGQCAQYCGVQHAKMLLRVYVDSPEQFDAWVAAQKRPAQASDAVARGRHIFESTACVNCHTVNGTIADGRFGPDLTHLATRDTIASGAAANTHENLKLWIHDPDAIKPGCLMPAMNLPDPDLEALAAYMESLK
ncbi:MAG TPA: cytochrome c oxidase subunit II [Candidatus Eremiobacteraceae bacterium]|nr:cytochrome c oxidase subunit II [Candidatus Eremiobacteraceae bacterium]